MSITKSFGVKKHNKIIFALVCAAALILFIVALCVHTFGLNPNKPTPLDFTKPEYYRPKEADSGKSDDFMELVKSGDYEKYKNIYKYENYDEKLSNGESLKGYGCKAGQNKGDILLSDSELYYGQWMLESVILVPDPSLPSQTIHPEAYVCSVYKNFDRGSFNFVFGDFRSGVKHGGGIVRFTATKNYNDFLICMGQFLYGTTCYASDGWSYDILGDRDNTWKLSSGKGYTSSTNATYLYGKNVACIVLRHSPDITFIGYN